MNLNKWFNFRYEIIYFYNVYGKATYYKTTWLQSLVYLKIHMLKPLSVVRPGSQSEDLNVIDTVKACYYAYKK